jgi:hypothetical protein
VFEHRTVNLIEDISTDFHHQVRSDVDDLRVQCGVVELA